MKMSKKDVLTTTIKFYEAGGKVGMVHSGCVYLAPNGGRCTVGVLLHEIGYSNHDILSMNGASIDDLFDQQSDLDTYFEEDLHKTGLRADDSFLEKVQHLHDDTAMSCLRQEEIIVSAKVAVALRELAVKEGVEL